MTILENILEQQGIEFVIVGNNAFGGIDIAVGGNIDDNVIVNAFNAEQDEEVESEYDVKTLLQKYLDGGLSALTADEHDFIAKSSEGLDSVTPVYFENGDLDLTATLSQSAASVSSDYADGYNDAFAFGDDEDLDDEFDFCAEADASIASSSDDDEHDEHDTTVEVNSEGSVLVRQGDDLLYFDSVVEIDALIEKLVWAADSLQSLDERTSR